VRDRQVVLTTPLVAGVLNVTPDSFSDGGRYGNPGAAIARARTMVAEGAAIIDVGAESTRPGAAAVSVDEEWGRLEPVLSEITRLGVPVSVDTTKLEIALRAIEVGVHAINDISGLQREPRLAELAASTGAGLVVGHMRGTPRSMQRDTEYRDLVGEVRGVLADARDAAVDAGCAPEQVALDPGLGFGKSVEGNFELIARIDEIAALGAPLWVGPSRKSFIGYAIGAGPGDRLAGTIAACLGACRGGADVVRVHDVQAVRDALDVERKIRSRRESVPGAEGPDRAGDCVGQTAEPAASVS